MEKIPNINSVKVGQYAVEPGQPEKNLQTALSMLKETASGKFGDCSVLVFPEFCLSGYLIGDLWEEVSFLRDLEEMGRELQEEALALQQPLIFGNVGLDWESIGEDGRVRKYNAAFLSDSENAHRNGLLNLGFHPKTLLPDYREFEETRHFYDLRRLCQEKGVSLEDAHNPYELILADGSILKAGLQLCEDGWDHDYGVSPTQYCVQQSPDLLVNLSSSPYTLGKDQKRNRVFSRRASELQISILYANHTGIQNNAKTLYSFDGASTLYTPQGPISGGSTWKHGVISFHADPLVEEDSGAERIHDMSEEHLPEVYHCLKNSISGYMNQCGLKKVVIGASGGIDSAVSASLFVSLLGSENVILVNMPGEYNSGTTISLSRQLAENLNTWYCEIPIKQSVALTTEQVHGLEVCRQGQTGGEERLCLELSEFALENVQARDRSSRILAAVSAAFGAVFTCNANKAEMMVGYSTLYGDHGGFLAPLADLWKCQVYGLGRWMDENVHSKQMIPEGVYTIQPSAELNPSQSLDAGGGDPLKYWYHDRLFHSWLQRWSRWSPEEVLSHYAAGTLERKLELEESLESIFKTPREFIDDLERWYRLFKGLGCVKRVQSPTVCAVSRRAFGFDYREAIMTPYFSRKYLALKEKLLASV